MEGWRLDLGDILLSFVNLLLSQKETLPLHAQKTHLVNGMEVMCINALARSCTIIRPVMLAYWECASLACMNTKIDSSLGAVGRLPFT